MEPRSGCNFTAIFLKSAILPARYNLISEKDYAEANAAASLRPRGGKWSPPSGNAGMFAES